MRKLVNATIGFFIGTMLSLGAAGALVTAFQLPMLHFSAVVGACVLGALLGAAAFSGKRGGALLLLLGALAGGYLWRQGDLWDQTRYLLELISQVYNQAYHWGYLVLLSGAPAPAGLDLPVAALGAAMALLGSWTVCREQTGALALCASILTLTPCLVVTDTVPAPSYLYPTHPPIYAALAPSTAPFVPCARLEPNSITALPCAARTILLAFVAISV